MAKKRSYQEIFPEEEILEEVVVEEPVIAPVPKLTYTVKVTHPSLRMRQAPSTDAEILGLITDQGEYEIFETKDGWGQLQDGSWIMLSFTKKI